MKRYLCLLFTPILFIASDLLAESDQQRPVADVYIVRTAEQLQSPHVVTYRMAEWAQMRGKWIFPDVGYYDTGYGKEQIWFAGAGADLLHSKRVDWEQELYVSQQAAPESHNQRAVWVWTVLDARLRPGITGQLVAYPTIPLDRAQRWGYDVDRIKFEWAASSHWQSGVGYAGSICTSRSWQHNPFLTVARTTPAGKFEVWFQRISGGAQLQLRYLLVRDEKSAL